jgi:hypothetical protein
MNKTTEINWASIKLRNKKIMVIDTIVTMPNKRATNPAMTNEKTEAGPIFSPLSQAVQKYPPQPSNQCRWQPGQKSQWL